MGIRINTTIEKDRKLNLPLTELHKNGGILARAHNTVLVVLFTGKTEGIVVRPDLGFDMFETDDKWTPYYDSTHWEILSKGAKIKIKIQQK